MLNSLLLALRTADRKLRRAFKERGVIGALLKAAALPVKFARHFVRELRPAQRRYRIEERQFDRRFRVDTRRDSDPGWMARITSSNWCFGTGYAPAPISRVREVLQDLAIPYETYAFIDYGAGKGRVLLLAAELPFQSVVGVEYSPRLCSIAAQNLRECDRSSLRCRDVQIIEADAANFELPLSPLVLFFHHPFEAPVFRQVIETIETSLSAVPRPVHVIYMDLRCSELFEDHPAFASRRFYAPRHRDDAAISIYESAPLEAATLLGRAETDFVADSGKSNP